MHRMEAEKWEVLAVRAMLGRCIRAVEIERARLALEALKRVRP